MANRKRAEARRKAQAKASRTSGEGGASGKGLMWAAIAVIIVIAAGIGIFVASGDDGGSSDNSASTQPSSKLPDSQPVTITGDSLVAFADGAEDTAIGLEAPVVSGLNFGGEEIVLDAKATGRPYMVVFLAHWCPHCNAEVPRLNDWKHSGAVPAGLDVIGVATAVSKSSPNYPPASWFSNKGWEWPVLVDEADGDGAAGKAAQAFGASGWPYFVIVGADGKVKVRVSGEIKTVSELESIVDKALAA
ncbi:MAG: TlpA disulfide reductase family protein [Ilumatobacteraceae bacterium]